MSQEQLLDRPAESDEQAERDSFWSLPRATIKVVAIAARVQDDIERGLPAVDCFGANQQYWLQIHDQIQALAAARFKDQNFTRLPAKDGRLIEELDGIKLDFCGGMIASWRLGDKTPTPAPIPASDPTASPRALEKPWPSRSLADINSRRRHALNLDIETDYEHLWVGWLVSSERVHPLQVGYDNYRLQIAELQDSTTATKDLLDKLHSQEHSGLAGSGDSLIERQLNLLNSTTTRAQAAYTRALQAV